MRQETAVACHAIKGCPQRLHPSYTVLIKTEGDTIQEHLGINSSVSRPETGFKSLVCVLEC